MPYQHRLPRHKDRADRLESVARRLAGALCVVREACGEPRSRAEIAAWNRAEEALDLWRASQKPEANKRDP